MTENLFISYECCSDHKAEAARWMSAANVIERNQFQWYREAGVSDDALAALVEHANCVLPSAYLDFLRISNGGEGELPVDPLWFIIWPAEEVIDSNHDLEVAKYAPGFFGFAGNGGNEIFHDASPSPKRRHSLTKQSHCTRNATYLPFLVVVVYQNKAPS
jgi:hypothetical protein